MRDVRELFDAIAAGDAEAVRRIVAADPAAAALHDENGTSALLAAVYRGRTEIAEALRATGLALDVFEASAVGDLARVRELVVADPMLARTFNDDGFHALGLAAFFGHPEVVRYLIDAGADVSAQSRNRMRVAALHSAIAARDRESTLALIAAGADVNAKQQDGFTPLHEAAQNGDREVVDALLAAGADPSLALDGGKTPADLAREGGHEELAKTLEAAPSRSL